MGGCCWVKGRIDKVVERNRFGSSFWRSDSRVPGMREPPYSASSPCPTSGERCCDFLSGNFPVFDKKPALSIVSRLLVTFVDTPRLSPRQGALPQARLIPTSHGIAIFRTDLDGWIVRGCVAANAEANPQAAEFLRPTSGRDDQPDVLSGWSGHPGRWCVAIPSACQNEIIIILSTQSSEQPPSFYVS